MPKYFFTAKSQKGENYSGYKEAKDEQDLARILRKEGYILISTTDEAAKKKKSHNAWRGAFSFFGGVSLKDKIMFTRNLKVMISSGISIPRSLKILAEQSENKTLKRALVGISEKIIKGENFSDSIASYPNIFSQLFCSMIKVGEESGTLEKNFDILAKQMEREYSLKSKIQEAMMYPSVIILAMMGIGIMMLVMVVPNLAKTFEELEAELPLTTKIVIGLGTFLAEKWHFAIFLMIIFLFLGRIFLKTKKGKTMFDTMLLKLPVISMIVKKTNSAYTVRTLGSLVAAGVPLVRSLEIVAQTLGNVFYKTAIMDSLEKVKKGEKLSASLGCYHNLYPLMVVQMIEVGEETGETSAILEKLGDFFEEEISQATRNLAAVIEPILMLIIGGVVGFFAISMVQPMYSMLRSIK
ncbi:MAG: type II secretion system F family protein [Candidatus Nealsonbacteria bacterium]